MSHRGVTSLFAIDPYGVGVGPHARTRLSLRGLGEDVTDFGVAARQAALDSARQDRLQRMYEEEDAAKRAAEREKVLQIAQDAVRKARGAQADILTSGQNQLRRLLFAGSGIALVALGAITVASVFGGRRRSKGLHVRRSKSKRTKRRRTWKPMSHRTPSPIGVVP